MKKLLIACSMVGACALVACADPSVQGTPKTQELSWFNVTTSLTNGGTLAVLEGSDALCEIVNSKFEIDSDIDNPVVFTAADSLTQQMAKVTFNLDAAVVPYGALQTFGDENKPKVAFAIFQSNSEGTETNFVAWVGGQEWITLTGATVPDEGTSYALAIEFDNTDGNKVRFSVGGTSLKNGTVEWISYGDSAVEGDDVKVNFVGCGKVSSFVGKQIYVSGEIVVIGGKGSVEINNEAKAAFEKVAGQGGVDAFLASNAKESFGTSNIDSTLLVAEAYALGLIVKSGDTMEPLEDGNGALKVKADAQASTTGGIPVKLNIQPPDDSGATISYQVQGSTDGTSFTPIDGTTATSIEQIKIPTDYVDGSNDKPKYRFFKVVTTVTLKGGQTPAQQD